MTTETLIAVDILTLGVVLSNAHRLGVVKGRLEEADE